MNLNNLHTFSCLLSPVWIITSSIGNRWDHGKNSLLQNRRSNIDFEIQQIDLRLIFYCSSQTWTVIFWLIASGLVTEKKHQRRCPNLRVYINCQWLRSPFNQALSPTRWSCDSDVNRYGLTLVKVLFSSNDQ